MTNDRAWVLLKSGRRLDLLNPHPHSWTDEDLATGLARTYRWGGHSKWELPLSVAQHSLTVLHIRMLLAGRTLTAAERLRELAHDMDEGLLGFDAITPLKPHLGDGYASVVKRLRVAIRSRYDLRRWDQEGYKEHKYADRLAAASEAHQVVGWSAADIRSSLGITLAPLDVDPVPVPPGMQPWEPWPPKLAAQLFLDQLEELQRPTENQSPNLRSIVDRVRPSVDALIQTELKNDMPALVRHVVRANVRVSVDHLRHGSRLLETVIQEKGLAVVGAEYSLETGAVEFFDTAGAD